MDAAKEALYARLRLEESGPGFCHFPLDRDDVYFRQLTAEFVVTRYHKGRPIREWRKKANDRNEALDCRVYAMAALQGLIAMGLQLNREAAKVTETPIKSSNTSSEPTPPRRRPQRRVITSSWM